MDFIQFEPATLYLFWAAASNFLTTGEGGRFRWGNIYGNSAIILLAAISNSIGYSAGSRREQALAGMGVGVLGTVLPALNICKWRRMIRIPYAAALGTCCTAYYAKMYYVETMAIEDAGED